MRHLALTLATFATLAAIMLSASVRADQKFFTPADCQPYGQSSDYSNMPIRADGIRNTTGNTNKYIICPLNRDQESGWQAAGDAALADVYFKYVGNGTITCILTEGQDFAGFIPEGTETRDALPLVGNLRHAEFPAFGIGAYGGTITCRLPPGAKFLSIIFRENGATD